MEKGLVDLSQYKTQIDEVKRGKSYSLKGDEGICFIEKDEVIKIYWNHIDKDMCCDLSKYASSRIAFPKKYFEDKIWRYGEIMPYFPYKLLGDGIDCSLKVESLLKHYYVIENEISKFPNLRMIGLGHSENIFFSSENGFFIVDTTPWREGNSPFIGMENIRQLDQLLFTIFNIIINDSYDCSFLLNEVNNSYRGICSDNNGRQFLEILNDSLRYRCRFNELIMAYLEIIKTYYNCEVETLGDIKKYTKMLKNS